MQTLIAGSPFHQQFSPQVMRLDHDTLTLVVKMAMGASVERQPHTGQWHGGAVSAVVDIVGCYALALVSGEPLPTINFRTDYLRPGVRTALTASAYVRRAGRTIGVVDVDVTDDSNRLVAVGRASYAMLGGLTPR
jgi:uncharacterized protein (TIGR00369 family)